MPYSRVHCARSALASAGLWLLVAVVQTTPSRAAGLCCNQTSAERNANLVCAPAAATCTVAAQTINTASTCPGGEDGCELDFGDRPVSLTGTFTIGAGRLSIRARSIAVDARIAAAGAAGVELRTTAASCSGGAGDLVVRSPIDASAASTAGSLRLLSACDLVIASTSQLLASSGAAFGGTIDLRAGGNLTLAGPVKATGGGGDGGLVTLAAGADVRVQRAIDVRSFRDGDGGTISLRAGDGGLAAGDAGGALTITADLLADGSTDADGSFGNSGGDVALEAAGPIVVAATGAIRANGAGPDGAGGTLTVSTEAAPTGVLTALDGDVTLLGPISLRGAANGDGGELLGSIGRGLALQGTLDISAGGDDAFPGSIELTTGADLRLDAAVSVNGRTASASGGAIDLKAGLATDTATLTITRNIDLAGGSGADGGDARLAACRIDVKPGVTIDTRGANAVVTDPTIVLAAVDALTIGANARFLAPSGSGTLVVSAPETASSIAASVQFVPKLATQAAAPGRSPFPPCPRCGDGIRQPGEPCDPGAGADGSCCRSDCLGFVCATPSATPTPGAPTTAAPATDAGTGTPTRTPTPTATPTLAPAPVAPRAVLGCARALAKETTRLVGSELASLDSCAFGGLACLVDGGGEGSACMARAARRCRSRFAKLARARATFANAFEKSCAGDPPVLPLAALRSPALLNFAAFDETCAAEVGLDLSSASAIRTCLEHGACAAERVLATAFPSLAALVPAVVDVTGAGLCLPFTEAANLPLPSRAALRCQRAVTAAGRKLLDEPLAVVQRCAGTLLACRLTGRSTAVCEAENRRCAAKLAALADPANGALARFTARVVRGCSSASADDIVAADGLGFGAVTDACAALGAPPPTDATTLAPCIGAAYACTAAAFVSRAAPFAAAELARVGLALGEPFACPANGVAPTASPTATPGSGTAARTATPTPTPTNAPVTLLLPGGGVRTRDCILEWTVGGRAATPPPITTVDCVDGDPACDLDGVVDGVCRLRVGVCLTGTDPELPECPAAAALASLTLQSPQPTSANPIDAANAAALVGAVGALTAATPGGAGANTFTFTPPLALPPPAHCTTPVDIVIERRGLTRRAERFRARAVAADRDGAAVVDDDTTYLGCVAPH